MNPKHRAYEPIAIVGMACRYPGELEDLSRLWNGLQNLYSAISETPAERWSAARYYSPLEVSRGKAYVRRGGYLKRDPRLFDAAFFGISPRDAENMDPQQRLMLEVTWEAFENAGLKLPEFARRNVGVYVGGFMLDHMITQMSFANRSAINQYSAAGMMMTMLSNRISHTFDFRGPSLSIDTACSSSLVAFHYACQDIWTQACELAVVGGVNVMMRPEYPIGMCKGHFLARDGRCKSFDKAADGYGRAEGAGVVLLKPLSRALAAGDDIWATVIASGTNQDGRTPGISMPNGESQAALIRTVCHDYAVDPRSIQYVECHGTGTAIGDPTEAAAIGATYGLQREPTDAVIIGSIKSNLGHMEAGAGVAGIIKAALTLKHRETSPLASLETPNPQIDFARLGIRLSDQRYRLHSADGAPARAAVNSFGYGGSNAHVILEEYRGQPLATTPLAAEDSPKAGRRWLLPISARSAAALPKLGRAYLEMLEAGVPPQDLIYSLIKRRPHLNHRAIIAGSTSDELQQRLKAWMSDETDPGWMTGHSPSHTNGKPMFVFTGMGPQWWAMGQELYANNSVYRSTVQQADAVFQQVSGFSILEEMLKDEQFSQITRTEFAQPANFVLQIGLVSVLHDRGIEPGGCLGHSVGELASAYTAGALTLKDAMRVCFHRSQQQARARGQGSMLAVGITLERAQQFVATSHGCVAIAAVNGEKNITLAGDTPEIVKIAEQLSAENLFNRLLEVEVPYHGPAMDPLMGPLESDLQGIVPQPPKLPLYSTVTGQLADGAQQEADYGPSYWPQNIRKPVEFVRAVQSAIADGFTHFIEVGPHPVLSTALKECLRSSNQACFQHHTLRRNTSESAAIDRTILEFFAAGGNLQWERLVPQGNVVDLPNYPWQREMLWVENERAAQDRMNPIVHPILGTQEAPATYAYRNDFDYQDMHYLRQHQVMGLPILPAAGYVEAFFELAAIEHPNARCWALRDFDIAAPLIMKDDRGIDFVTTYDPHTRRITARSLENGRMGAGQVHASAMVWPIPPCSQTTDKLEQLQRTLVESLDCRKFYQQLHAMGLQYGSAFQTIQELFVSADRRQSLARLSINADWVTHLEQYKLHPTLLDGCFQTLMAMIDARGTTYLPTHIAEIRLMVEQLPAEIWCHGSLVELNSNYVECHLELYDAGGQLLVTIQGLRANAAAKRQRVDKWGDPVKLQILNYSWRVGNTLSEPKRLGHWLVVGDAAGLGSLVTTQLENFGALITAQVSAGPAFAAAGRDFTIRPESIEDWQAVLANCGELDGIVFTSPVDATVHSDDPAGEQQLRTVVTGLQAFLRAERSDSPRIYVVTQSAFHVLPGDVSINPAQASVNGFCRVAFNELEVGRISSIDLPSEIDAPCFEALIQELICDAPEDEVSIRDGQRFVSELGLVDDLSKDVWQVTTPGLTSAIAIRPSMTESDVGTVRVLASSIVAPASNQVCLEIEKCAVPIEFIKGGGEDLALRPWMEFVGTVLAIGDKVTTVQAGSRICGFTLAESASHITVAEGDLHAVEITAEDSASQLIAAMRDVTCAVAAMRVVQVSPGEHALVEASSLGYELGNLLQAAGVHVQFVTDDPEALDPLQLHRHAVGVVEAGQLDQLVQPATADGGFSILAARADRWRARMGWRHVSEGAVVIDLADESETAACTDRASLSLRIAVGLLAHRGNCLRDALAIAVQRIRQSEPRAAGFFEVSVADLAWRKLPFNDSLGKLLLAFDRPDVELPIVQRDELSIADSGTYLITGGLGGFGQQTARWLLQHGVRSLVLTSRTGAETPEKQRFVEELKNAGAQVWAVACDAADRQAVRRLLEKIKAELPPLKGIIHSAAAIIDEPIAEIRLQNLSAVMRNKAFAAWVLHEETRDIPLDHFILYSSAANLVGNSRQSIYSAANGFLNGLAHMRRQQGLPGLSLNWGAIADVGIVARDEKLEQFLRYVGLSGLESAEALEYLKLAMVRQVTQVGVLIMKSWSEWGRFEVRAGTSPRYQKLIASDASGNDTSAQNALIEELSTLNYEEQLEVLMSLIADVLASVLKTDAALLHASRPINELGVDSLIATEIQMTLEQTLGLKIAVLELLGDSTILSLARNALANLQIDNRVPVG